MKAHTRGSIRTHMYEKLNRTPVSYETSMYVRKSYALIRTQTMTEITTHNTHLLISMRAGLMPRGGPLRLTLQPNHCFTKNLYQPLFIQCAQVCNLNTRYELGDLQIHADVNVAEVGD